MWPEQHLSRRRSIVYAYTAFTVYSTEGVLGCGGCGSTAAKWRRVLLRIERRSRDSMSRGEPGSRYRPGVCVERAAGGGAFAPRMPYRDASPVFSLCGRMRNECAVMCYFRDRVRPVRHAVGLRDTARPARPAGTESGRHHTGLGRTGPSSRFFHGRPCQQPLSLAVNAVPDLPRDVDRGDAAVGHLQSEHDEIQQHAPAWACSHAWYGSSPWCERSQSYSLRFNNMSAQVCARMHFVLEDDETNETNAQIRTWE